MKSDTFIITVTADAIIDKWNTGDHKGAYAILWEAPARQAYALVAIVLQRMAIKAERDAFIEFLIELI